MYNKIYKRGLLEGIFNISSGVAGIASQIPMILDGPEWLLHGPVLLSSSYLLYSGVRNVKDVCNFKKKLDEIINSDDYKECQILYDEYVNDIAKLLNDLNFSSDLESLIVATYAMKLGYFSQNNNYKYACYDDDNKDWFYKIMGSRVATGAACCRHNAYLLSDIINKMGGKAATLSVNNDYQADMSKKEVNKLQVNHMVTSCVHDGVKIAFDPTVEISSGVLGLGLFKFASSKYNKDILTNYFSKADYLISNNANFAEENMNKLKEIGTFPNIDEIDKFDGKYFTDLYIDVYCRFLRSLDDFNDFHCDEKPKIKRLANLNERVIPHGKIKE